MSRIAKKPIAVPDKTEVTASGGDVTVKGPLGTLTRRFLPEVSVSVSDNAVHLKPTSHSKLARALWGTYAAHVHNMLRGVCEPFVKRLIVEGIGFKTEVRGDELIMNLGFSHPVKIKIPGGLKVSAEQNLIAVSGIDKELVGQFAALVRDKKKAEPYKGKGIRYQGEVIKRKQGKKTA